MPVKVLLPSKSKLTELKVLQNTIYFDEHGVADGSELTPEEIARLRRFHFRVEVTPDKQETDNGTSDDGYEKDDGTPTSDPNETGIAQDKPKQTSRSRNKKDGE
ncbi:MAG: hypothetical protein K6T83_03145 [Alicyclobacillus sp.]|nr:hypothetical protein [Alicyclobacillus sp.]